MSLELDIAKKYFDLSNESNFKEIEKLFDKGTTFCSRDAEIFLGVEDIMQMQRKFHGSFKNLYWHVLEFKEEKPGIVKFDFEFKGTKESGEQIVTDGFEYVVVQENKIRHIEVRTKK